MQKKLFESAAQVLRLVLKFEQPADAVLSLCFRDQRTLGQHDRAFVAEAVFGVLRHKRVLDHLTVQATARRLLLAWLVTFEGARDVTPLLKAGEAEWLAQMKSVSLNELPAPVRAELPDWVYERVLAQLGEAQAL